ncbi:uncharacterized protein C18orf63 homolog [Xenentodon cancila]
MSGRVQKSLFFLGLPDLKKLVCTTLTLEVEEAEEMRSKQMKSCRELVLLYADVLASPALDSFTDITVVVALGSPQTALPGDLQRCVSFSLISRLAPSWNKVGLYLVCGKDFLTERGRLDAITMELSTTEGHLCMSIEVSAVRLPPTTLEDFELPPLVLRRFCSDPDCVLDPSSTGRPIWCHVLPSMKKGQITTISRQLPRDGPFRTYRDLQNHWNRLYGYRLPELPEKEVVYCSVYFRPLGSRLFTYPLSCIRLQPVQRCPRVDLQGVSASFLSHVRDRLQSVCGFPARLTSKPCFQTVSLSTAASIQTVSDPPRLSKIILDRLYASGTIFDHFSTEPAVTSSINGSGPCQDLETELSAKRALSGVVNGDQINLTTSISIRPVPTQLPALLQPVEPLPLPSPTPVSLQDGALEPLRTRGGFGKTLTQTQTGGGGWSSSFLSSISSLSYHQVKSPSEVVPIFRNRIPSRHVNVALLRVQKQKEHLCGGQELRRRVTLPAFRRETPGSSFSSTVAASLALPPPPPPRFTPRFSRRAKPSSSPAPQPPPVPKVTHISSLSPPSKLKPAIILAPKPRSSTKTGKSSTERDTIPKSSSKTQENVAQPPTLAGVSDEDPSTSSNKKVGFKLKSRAGVQDVDVEKMAKSNQLSRVNPATLLVWLKRRGVPVGAKHRKEELMMKVMSCLAEA